MGDINFISRETLANKFMEDRLAGRQIAISDPVELVRTVFGSRRPSSGSMLDESILSALNNRNSVGRNAGIVLNGVAQNGFDVSFKGRGTVMEQIRRGVFSGSTNTLNDNWNDLFDAVRFDLTLRKQAHPTVRQHIFNVIDMPGATKDVRPSELFPYAVAFEEHNGEGQSVRLGANVGGQYNTIPMKIYAAGFVWTLLAKLFDMSYDVTRLNDGVALAYSAKQDDLALSTIIGGTYTGTKATVASTEGDSRQEKLWNTVFNAVTALCARKDPVTKRLITGTGMVLMVSSEDARRYNLIGTLPSDRNKNYPRIPGVDTVVGYDGETIAMPDGDITYTGCTTGTGYLIKKNRYLNVIKKTGLITEIDDTPDVKTLAQKEQAWFFSEGLMYEEGIDSYVQKVTLPW